MEPYKRRQLPVKGVGPKIRTVGTTVGKFTPIGEEEKLRQKRMQRKENAYSIFFVTINTNMNYASAKKQADRDTAAERLRDALDNLFGNADSGDCSFVDFFKLVPGQYSVYENDNASDEKFCGFFKDIWIKATTEWSSKSSGRRMLHAHAIIKVVHSTRIHINKDTLARYIATEMGMNHLPYVHIDMVNSSFYEILNYIQKDVGELPAASITPDSITDDVMEALTKGMENLNIRGRNKYY